MVGGRRNSLHVLCEPDRPAGGLSDLIFGHALVQTGHRQLTGFRVGLKDAQVSHNSLGASTRKSQPLAMISTLAVANGGDEVELVDEGALRLPDDQKDFLGRARDLRSAAGAGQAYLGLIVTANHRGVQIGEAVDLCRPQKANVDAPSLQPIAKDLRSRDNRICSGGQVSIAYRKR